MANDYKMVNDKRVQLTDEEQKVKDAETKAWADATSARRMTELRKQRDALLAETDYMGLGDVTMSDEWKAYRQALRDITKTAEPRMNSSYSYLDLSSVTFPNKPS